MDGGVPNGASGHSVVSGDKRYARAIAFDSSASDLVAGDTNGQRDVFVVLRAGVFSGDGSKWKPGTTLLVSRTASGVPANGPSFSPAIDGAFQDAETRGPSCIAFRSAASNIVPGDHNGKVDAFRANLVGGAPTRISPPVDADTTAVAVSGDCSLIAMVTGGKLYLHDGKRTRHIATDGTVSDPSFSTGRNQDLVFATPSGIWLLKQATSKAVLVAPGGQNPAYNDVKRPLVTYEKHSNGHTQIMYRDIGGPERLVSGRNGASGNGDSRDPVIGNGGYAIAFETDASNLGLTASRTVGDNNGASDVYLYSDKRKVTLLESVEKKAVPLPGGGRNPGMNFYNNYVTFDSPAPLGSASGPPQVYMRYLGGATTNVRSDEDALETPTEGVSAGVVPFGRVFIQLPPGSSPKQAKALGLQGAARGFVRLTRADAVPIGSTLDTTRGRVGLFTSQGLGRPLNEGSFSHGRFMVTQRRKNPLTTLSMGGGGLSNCTARVPPGGARRPIATAARRGRRLFSSVHGHFRTRGRNSTATVRGTEWTMTDTCAGTLTRVTRGIVNVRDLRLRKTRLLHKGQKYFARAK
jgi:hypothetical protein